MTIFQIIGVAGFLSYLSSFALLQFRVIPGNGYLYTLLNMLGATLVLISLIEAFNLASLLISVSWIIIGIVGLVLKYWSDKRLTRKSQTPMITG